MSNTTSKLKMNYFVTFCVLILITTFGKLSAQCTFTALSGTYTPLTGGTAITSIQADDRISSLIPLGFSFRYNGKYYNQAKVSSNGFITFRATATSSSANITSDSLVLAVLCGDLSGSSTGTASYITTGTAPNRIFTMEWLNWRWNYTATQAGISMQVKLYETSNRIEFIYRQESGSLANPSVLIGLSFQRIGNFMDLTNSSSSPSITTTSYTYIAQKPNTGQIYRFDEVISPKADNHVTNFASLATGSVSVKWTDAIGTNLPSRYLIKASNVSLAAITNPVDGTEVTQDLDLRDGTGAVYVDNGTQSFNGWTDSVGNLTMYMKIFPVANYYSNTKYKTDGTVPQLQINVPFYQARNLTFPYINSTSMTLNWVRGSGTNCVVFAKENGTSISSPVNNTTYTANTVYGSGTQIGSTGWYCIYNGNSNNVTVTGLKLLTNYAFHVIEYSGVAGAEQYSVVNEPTGHLVQTSNIFTEQTGISFANLVSGASAWGDYNNDGFLDVMISGSDGTSYLSKLYKNNGNNTFTEQTGISFTGVAYSQISWGDYDNDGFIDLLFEGTTSSKPVTKIYHNNGNNTFTELTSANLTALYQGSALWGDYDNDGYLDILLTGYNGSAAFSMIYHNNHNNAFVEQTSISLVGVYQGKSAWFDYDNDGKLDVILTGTSNSGHVTKIYHNNGNNTFTEQTAINLTGNYYSDVATGDYDNDGYPDILLGGSNGSSPLSKIYHNNANGTFTELTSAAITGAYTGSASWIDVDNDGLLDISISGLSGITNVSKIYKNNGNGTFTEQTNYLLPGIDLGSTTWADYDNDGDLDVLLIGNTQTGRIAKIFKNDSPSANTSPQAPTALTSNVNGEFMVLNWKPVKTDATPYKAMSYNVRIGKTSSASDIMACHSSSTGFRRIVGYGNTQLDTFYTIRNLKKGTYFWSVQAVDNSFIGGAFGAEQTFVYNIDIQPKTLKTISIKSTSLKLQWSRGNGDKCIVFMKENSTDYALPLNNSTYTANPFGSGSQIGTTGWYCVYNGTLDTTTVTNLKVNTPYRIEVIEYTGTTGNETYYTATGTGNLITQVTDLFTEQTGISLTPVSDCTATWGDYDNDGDLDILLTGNTNSAHISKIYKNNGNGTFTEQTAIPLTGVSNSSAAWGDYNNDGYLDILLTGYAASSSVSKIYKNNGDGTFTEQTNILLPGIFDSSVAWGDYDNDGYLDILLTGNTGSAEISKIYHNNGNNTFIEQTSISLPGISGGSVAWGDYDNDGYLDIILSGSFITKIFRNNGNNTFTEQTGISLTGFNNSAVAWGDYNNDGYLDILLVGSGSSKIYRNNGNNTFTEQTAIALVETSSGSASWGDYNNDGNLDILINGWANSTPVSKIYKNNGDNTFSEKSEISLTGVYGSSLAFGDYDNDRDLDILLTGFSGSSNISKIYRNDISTPNILPASPTGLKSNCTTNAVLAWRPTTTDATPAKSMTYNVRVGKSSGASDIVSPMAAASGLRRINAMGNAQTDTTFILRNLKKGTYYWSVQAIDNSFAGSAFAPEQTFVYSSDNPSSMLTFTAKSATSLKCNWLRGNGDNCAVFACESGTGTASPINNASYTGNKTFGSGTQIGTSGWFCVYNGSLDTATITNLKPNIEYRFQVIEYSGIAGAEVYSTTVGTDNPRQYLPPFTEQVQISITGISGKVEAWGDYNNDGYLDLFIAGNDGSTSIAKLYKNNRDNTFTEVTTALFSISTAYDATWCDYDNDGDMDILIAGLSNSKLYTNNGDGTFTLKTQLPSVYMGKSAWADLDNDGFKDLILTGASTTSVLKNNHDGTFTAQTNTLPGLTNYCSVTCGDYDNDGDQDILLAGYSNDASAEITKVYKNDGNFIFTEQTGIALTGIANCAVAWADMDNDGDLDIVLSGGAADVYTKIYDNNGNNTFTELTSTPLKGLYRSSLAIADYDNDGYRDLLVTGSVNGSDYYNIVYHNNGNKTYSQSTTLTLPGLQFGSTAWGDYDNDGNLDLFLCGNSALGKIAKIFKNNCAVVNSNPSRTSLSLQLNGNLATINWGQPSDDKTAYNGLSYNLYLYETSKPGYTKSPEALPATNALNGRRLIARIGDLQYSSSGYTLRLPAGNYIMSIQAIDAGLLGGEFSNEGTFTIADLTRVGINVAANQITNTTSEMRYSTNSTDGTNGTWNYCSNGYTFLNYNTGGFDVWVRQNNNTTNKSKVASIAGQATAPSYTIDYTNETTNEAVPANDEYNTSSDMNAAIAGTNNKVVLPPGQNLYFRTKATTSAVASAIQTLTVPTRPSIPTFSVDYINEITLQVVSSAVEYSTTSNMDSANSGANMSINIVPGQSMYFRTKATTTAFKSNVQTLVISARPAAPSNLVINDVANTFNWDHTPNYYSSYDYEYSIDNGGTWTICSAKPTNVGNVNIAAGALKLRVKASSIHFAGDALVSNTSFSINTAIVTLKDVGIEMYPNPVSTILTIEGLKELSKISISDIHGKLIKTLALQNNVENIHVEDLPSGMYILTIECSGNIGQTKFIKQ